MLIVNNTFIIHTINTKYFVVKLSEKLASGQPGKGRESMKPVDVQTDFIRLRAEGKSYAAISKELGISKDTCSKWENALKDKISSLKAEQLSELYDSYYMTKEARIKKIGDVLQRIDDALATADLSEMSPEKLLDMKLKYQGTLKDEYVPVGNTTPLKKDFTEKDILNAFGELLNRVRSGEITQEQANRESTVLSNMLRAYEDVELKKKIETLEAIVGSRV